MSFCSWLPREAAEFALAVVKDSIIFYLGLQEAIVDREEADKLGGIIIVDFPLLRF